MPSISGGASLGYGLYTLQIRMYRLLVIYKVSAYLERLIQKVR